jgi:hypothetical protein
MQAKQSSVKSCGASASPVDLAEVRIFLDANVLFSAAKSDGFVNRLLVLLISEGHVLCADGYVAEEARRNLAAKGPDRLTELGRWLRRFEVSSVQVDPAMFAALSVLPENDRPVVAGAVRMKCEALMTGDRAHFGRFYGITLAGVAIHSPRTLAELLL